MPNLLSRLDILLPPSILICLNIYEYHFDNYGYIELINEMDIIDTIKTKYAKEKTYDITLDKEKYTVEAGEQIGQMEDVIELLLQIAYIMIEEADPTQVTTFEEFLKGIDGLFDETAWVNEVIELAASPISRGLQTHPQE